MASFKYNIFLEEHHNHHHHHKHRDREACACTYPAWKNWSVEHNEIKKRRIEERTEAFSGTLSVGRSSARIVGSVLFGRVEGVKEGRTRAAWQFPCHVSPTLGPAYDSDFPSVGSLPGPIGGPFLLVIRRVSLVRVARFLSSVGKRRRDRFSPEGCHFQLVLGASEQAKCPRCRHASELLFFLFFSLSDNERRRDVVEREAPCIRTRENGRLAFSPCSANFLRYTASRIQRQPTCLLSFNHTRGGRTVRGSNLTLLTRYPVLPIAIDAISRSGSRITGKKHHIGQERNEHT